MSYSLSTFMYRLYRLLVNCIKRFSVACRKVFQYSKENLTKAAKVLKIVAQGVYSFITPIVRPAGLAMALTVLSFTGLYAETLDTTSPDALINSAPYIFGILVTIGGYLSAYIPFLNKIDSGTYRVLALAIVAGIAFVMFGFSDVIPLLLAYASSTSIYEVILKLFFKSEKTEAAKLADEARAEAAKV